MKLPGDRITQEEAGALLGSSKAVARILGIYGREDPDWQKLARYLKNGQLSIDPEGQVRLRGDPFTRERFERLP
jgi:hypothetical protein